MKWMRSTVDTISVMLFLLLGIGLITAGFFPWLFDWLWKEHFSEPQFLVLFGLLFFLLGALRLAAIRFSGYKRSYRLETERLHIAVEPKLIEALVIKYWKKLLPDQQVKSRVFLAKNRIHLEFQLPWIDEEKQALFLKTVEVELQQLLYKTLNYKEPLCIDVSFEKSS